MTDNLQPKNDPRVALEDVSEIEAMALRIRPRRFRGREDLHALANRIVESRLERATVFVSEPLGEAGWNMLLTLFCSSEQCEPMSADALFKASDAPARIAHHWQGLLKEHGLIECPADGESGEGRTVHLTQKGDELIEAYLRCLIWSNISPPPHPETLEY